ncbi:MAG: bifunctional phosphoserine phosphatase/homoserine phosphotransferase ThrH [Propionibacteriaceae bacterium]|jgi:phosphoserine/homoserine phosphotransferase|nr:bifunctional phosphoserine phosphatase/homoserine phosphotransferase ThrH [Propionibacteriaceae bacterium]
MAMEVACLDLEGVLVPEVWIGVAERTGLAELRLTTRDISDYDELMRHRLRVLDQHGLTLGDIQAVIAQMAPLPGAVEFADWLKRHFQFIVLSDTFYDFAAGLMAALGQPVLFCHDLVTGDGGRIFDYRLRLANQKQAAVAAFQGLNFAVFAAGDSYNDTAMLGQADLGVLFRPPAKVAAEFPRLPVAEDYAALAEFFRAASSRAIPAL